MPTTKVKTSSGSVSFRYYISTPSSASAKSIDKKFPTLVFIHPHYYLSEVWQNQFDSPLRRFNLVAYDLRGHAATSGAVPVSYSRVDAAEDLAKLMDALKLPACTIVGADAGADIALEMAISQPAKVASIVLLGPLQDIESEYITAGRQEVADYWIEGCESGDQLACADAVYGALQLGYNNRTNALVDATLQINLSYGVKVWGSPKGGETFTTITVQYFRNKRHHRDRAELSKIKVPVLMVHGDADVSLSVEEVEDMHGKLQDAGVRTKLVVVEGAPRWGFVTNPKDYTSSIEEHVLTHCCPNGPPPMPKDTTSPFDATLRKHGWVPPSEEDSDIES